MSRSKCISVACSVVLVACALVLPTDVAAEKPRLRNPWKELWRPNCVDEGCRDADYAEHKRILAKEEKERKRQEKQAEKQRQKEACQRLKGSGTAHTTKQC